MERSSRICIVLLGSFLSSHILECKNLDGYEFPVYSTERCPRNQTEWNERSSAISCNETNGYVCLPNENITELLEFCYIYPFIWIQEGLCLYLNKRYSRVNSKACQHFRSGCPNSLHQSFKNFQYPSCLAIGNRCFLAEPSCNSRTTYSQDTTEVIQTENNPINYEESKTTYYNNRIDSVLVLLSSLSGVILMVYVVCTLFFCIRRNSCDQYGVSSLYIASQNGHDTIVLEKGADINLRCNDDSTVLYAACRNKRESTVNLLLNNGAAVPG